MLSRPKRWSLACALALALPCALTVSPAIANPFQSPLTHRLAHQAPDLNRQVLDKAVSAMQCAISGGLSPANHLAIIDFSKPSSEQRLWIFDLKDQSLVLRDFVAHGQNSGDNYATDFSNIVGSHQSSIGLFRTQESYFGRHGYSLRMDGLEPGVNDKARERAIVIHAADYVNPEWVERQGRIGRSQGCPAVRPEIAAQVVDTLKGGQFMFSYYPDEEWLQSSAYLNCQPNRVARYLAPLTGKASDS
ncbi:murein L,D-transpeptidase catalytic domain family protein [Nitrincola tapanii]|uniref:Murein L,D-transpeptidase catalytic domain family protein n=1 Tax=Nitrincola tapanii TaxID=1708751 RepID=A0A5A9W7I9_9GAMM|nr:murein L,D-transpeptidase catalytic domain family protein [Nitrincola tapanii]KAA0875421.1 murein L,D-transpeptidase catalytic domain family protein [Nitrincola tapanii]